MRAYVLITAEITKSSIVAQQLSALPDITDVAIVARGPYDIICTLEQPNEEAVYYRVMNAVLGVEGVARAVTCTVA